MPKQTSTAYVLYDNLLTHSSLAASSTNSGSHVRNAVDWRTNTSWQTSTTGMQYLSIDREGVAFADAFALARHNLKSATTGIVNLEYFDGSVWVAATTFNIASDNQTFLKLFNGVNADQWRLGFNVLSDQTLSIAVAMLGRVVNLPFGMPIGFIPPRHNPQIEYVNNKTEGGAFVGRSVVRKGYQADLKQPRVKTVWLRSEGEKFKAHAETKPFIFSWSHVKYPQDAVYCWASTIAQNETLDYKYQAFSMKLECI